MAFNGGSTGMASLYRSCVCTTTHTYAIVVIQVLPLLSLYSDYRCIRLITGAHVTAAILRVHPPTTAPSNHSLPMDHYWPVFLAMALRSPTCSSSSSFCFVRSAAKFPPPTPPIPPALRSMSRRGVTAEATPPRFSAHTMLFSPCGSLRPVIVNSCCTTPCSLLPPDEAVSALTVVLWWRQFNGNLVGEW